MKEELVKLAEPLRSSHPQWSDRVIDMFQQDGRFEQQPENGVDIAESTVSSRMPLESVEANWRLDFRLRTGSTGCGLRTEED